MTPGVRGDENWVCGGVKGFLEWPYSCHLEGGKPLKCRWSGEVTGEAGISEGMGAFVCDSHRRACWSGTRRCRQLTWPNWRITQKSLTKNHRVAGGRPHHHLPSTSGGSGWVSCARRSSWGKWGWRSGGEWWSDGGRRGAMSNRWASVVRPVRPLERSARARSTQVRSADSVQAVLQNSEHLAVVSAIIASVLLAITGPRGGPPRDHPESSSRWCHCASCRCRVLPAPACHSRDDPSSPPSACALSAPSSTA